MKQSLRRRTALKMIGLGSLSFLLPYSWINSYAQSGQEIAALHYKTLLEIAQMIKTKKISSEALTQLMFARIHTVDKRLNSYLSLMEEDAMAWARKMDKELAAGKYRGPLHGVPIGVKDLLYTTNAPTTGGHSFRSNFMAPYNATVIVKLQNAGAVIMGKLNLTEGAMLGYNATFKIPRNPWREDLYTGLSSSGSGVATAAGLCFGSIGTDTGGSIRYPSFANGVVGLKPTYGLVSRYGVLPLSPSLDHVGPMSRSVADAAVMLDAIAGIDANDPTSLQEKTMPAAAKLNDGLKGLKLGVDKNYITEGVDKALSGCILVAVEQLKILGADIVDFKMPKAEDNGAWFTICTREAYEANKETFPSRQAEYGKSFAELLAYGSQVTDEVYQKAKAFKDDYRSSFRNLLQNVDAVAAPAGGMATGMTDTIWRSNMEEGFYGHFGAQVGFQFGGPADLAGIPALTLPCGKSEQGMPPPGFQLMGGPLTEATLCQVGFAYEKATGWSNQHPQV